MHPIASSPVFVASVVAATTIAVNARAYYAKSTTKCDTKIEKERFHDTGSFRIESHLMDKIQQKKYLYSAKEGIPSTLRVLAIDLKEMRKDAFTGHCRLSHDKVFLDDVAPAKEIQVDNDVTGRTNKRKELPKGKKDAASKLKIPQKALVNSLVLCASQDSQRSYGVELLEASVADLNRLKLRKTHSLGSYSYDPGKYFDAGSGSEKSDRDNNRNVAAANEKDEREQGNPSSTDNEVLATEVEAPWNQYAWMEEMRLRINGQVHFDAPLEQSSAYRRVLFGNVYKVTVPAVTTIWDYFLPSFAKTDPDGVDGRNKTNVRACHKPHAVIANGAALQTVPGSLRLLQKICKKADVPLFIVHDPRGWGGNTHGNLEEALREMRSEIKNRVIGTALKQQGSSAFTRGRLLGQVETETKWQIRDKKRITKELLALDGGRRRKPEKRDWSASNAADLEKKLIDRKVIQLLASNDENDDCNAEQGRYYTPAMVEIARKCISGLESSSGSPSGELTSRSADVHEVAEETMMPPTAEAFDI